jgi:predicted CoA-binding protein
VADSNILEAEEQIAELVRGMRSVAVVGMKGENKADQAAHAIPRMMFERGYEIIPINPKVTVTLGQTALPSVTALDRRVDVVDVFRRSDAIPEVWLQSGIRHDGAAQRLAAAGMRVVQDRCLGVYVSRYGRKAPR